MFQEGDMYIHFTKYGGINKGTVRSTGESSCMDLANKVHYKKHHIITDKGIHLSLDGTDGSVYKVDEEYTDEYVQKMASAFKKFGERKRFMYEKMIKGAKWGIKDET